VFCADFGASCVRVDKVAVFSVHKRSIVDLLQNSIPVRMEVYSGIARFSVQYSTASLSFSLARSEIPQRLS